ncbi:MAG: stage III sporulation protein AF [Clostridia bacterium]|nr:stage III sporulation protein AF [Clostridia bacterium]
MVESLSVWAKSIVLAIIVVSILEMLLPNNKTKKYVKMVMGVFILYNIISPIIKDKNSLRFEELDVSSYISNTTSSVEVNQESMDRRLEELYVQELEKDITKKVEKQGFTVKSCKVKAKISDNENETGISKISLRLEKNIKDDEKTEIKQDLENKIINEVQKIKKIDTRISNEEQNDENTKLEKSDIQNLKMFLIQEYEVNEKCLEIN